MLRNLEFDCCANSRFDPCGNLEFDPAGIWWKNKELKMKDLLKIKNEELKIKNLIAARISSLRDFGI